MALLKSLDLRKNGGDSAVGLKIYTSTTVIIKHLIKFFAFN